MLSRVLKLILLTPLFGAFFPPNALADNEAEDFLCPGVRVEAPRYAQAYNLSYSSTLGSDEDSYSNRYLEADGRNTFFLNAEQSFYLYFRGRKQFGDETEKYVGQQADFGFRQQLCLRSDLSLSLSAYYGAPFNRDLTKYDQSRGQIATRIGLAWSAGEEGLSVTLASIQRRHLYRYTDNEGGKYLKQWGLEPSLTLSYSRGDWSATTAFVGLLGWDFAGEQLRSEFYHEEELAYAFGEAWSVFAVHKSDGYLANYGGTGTDIHLHDEDRSELGLGLRFIPE